MSDLDQRISTWRVSLGERLAPKSMDELEDHLRTMIDELASTGLPEDERLLVATHRLGHPDALAAELPVVESNVTEQPVFVPSTTPRAPFRQDPIDAWIASQQSARFVAGISAVLALLTALGMELYPQILQGGPFWLSGMFLAVGWVGILSVVAGNRYLTTSKTRPAISAKTAVMKTFAVQGSNVR